jgi:hypothetical protein
MTPSFLLAMTDDAQTAVVVIGVSGGILIAIIATISSSIQKTRQTRYREESRREIAAYVAEGSISPDDGAKLLSAGKSIGERITGC